MSRLSEQTSAQIDRFPRVSGDEPVIVAGNLAAGVFSPRERG